jgi:hypothetical protein
VAESVENPQEDPSWKDGRLVVRRPEIPDSQVASMNVPLTRQRKRLLAEIVLELINEKRQRDRETFGEG